MRAATGCCLGALVGLVAGLVLGALAIWGLFQITELHGAPLDLYAAFVLVCTLLGAVIGAVSPEPPER